MARYYKPSNLTTVPTAPAITVAALSSNVIRVTLSTPATDAVGIDSYHLEQSSDGGSTWTVLSLDASFPYLVTGLTASTTYYYRSRAANVYGTLGPYSTLQGATTAAIGTLNPRSATDNLVVPDEIKRPFQNTTSAKLETETVSDYFIRKKVLRRILSEEYSSGSGGSTPTWAAQTMTSRLPAIPRHSGPGVGSYGGSGRHTTPGNVTGFLLDDLSTATVNNAYGSYTRLRHGTIKGFEAISGPKFMVPIVSGYINQRDDFKHGSYCDLYFQFAPGPGIIWRETIPSTVVSFSPVTDAHDVRRWHLDIRPGDTSGGFDPGGRDGLGSSSGGNDGAGGQDYIFDTNHFIGWWLDEGIDGYNGNGRWSLQYCVIAEGLAKSIHDDTGTPDIHNYAAIAGEGHRFSDLSIQRSLFAHNLARNPEVAALRFNGANNIIYNCGDGDFSDGYGLQLTIDYDAASPTATAMYTNWVYNAYVKGPDSGNFHAVHMDASTAQPAGSQGFLYGNAAYQFTYASQSALMSGTFPASWSQSSLRPGWPEGWGSAYEGLYAFTGGPGPNAFSLASLIVLAEKLEESCGPKPGNRSSADRAGVILGHVLARLNGEPVANQGNVINSVGGTADDSGFPDTSQRFGPNAGDWPTIATVTEDPFNPTYWHAPLPMYNNAPDDRVLTSGTFSNGESKVGYTAIEAWAIEEHYAQGGK